MKIRYFVKMIGPGVIAVMFTVSCSSGPTGPIDSGAESVEFDVVTDADDADVTGDDFDSADIRPDAEDGMADADDETRDADSEVLVCGDVPREGCPCDEHLDKPCCLMPGQGLSCEMETVNGELLVIWGIFWDCGCIGGPPCEGWELYELCP